MSFRDCVDAAMNDPEIRADRQFGEQAKILWGDLADRYERHGRPRHVAEALATEDVKTAFKRQAAEQQHVALGQIAAMRRSQALVDRSDRLETLLTDSLEYAANSPNRGATVIGTQKALVRTFHHRLEGVIRAHGRDLLGRVRDPAGLRNLVRELHGESSGDLAAYAMADAVRKAFEDMRLMFNEAGGVIGKLEDWGLPHSHNRAAIRKAGFDAWAAEARDRIAWHKMADDLTGKPLAVEGGIPPRDDQDTILREMYDNVVFGRGSAEGAAAGADRQSLWRRRSHARVLPFRSADDWIQYNRKFGSGDPYAAMIGHAHKMARDIALIREFGPDPRAGFETRKTLAMQRARKEGSADAAAKIEGSAAHGERMLNILSGTLVPKGPFAETFATFMSSTRHILTAAFLDRAILSAVSDQNSMRLAAQSVGMGAQNVVTRHVRLMADSMTRQEAARAGWIADTLADPGLALARFQSEVPPAEIAERLSAFVIRAQGLAGWTDQARIAFQMEMAGHFAANAGRRIDEIEDPLRSLLREKRITDEEWRAFTNPETLFTASNGATFASPIYWREATNLSRAQADDLFLRLQALIEEQTEFAVPTSSTWARAFVEGGMPPGSIGYELLKSAQMFKSYSMSVSINQVRRILAMQGWESRAAYAFNLAAGATIMGALSAQLVELASGREPLDMTKPEFWGTAALRGGSFGVIGDLTAASNRPYGGISDYAAGPILGAGQDIADLLSGLRDHPAREAVRFLDRYTPGGDLPAIGLAADRLFWDQLQILLDPDSADALAAGAKKRTARNGNGFWWQPGDALPEFAR